MVVRIGLAILVLGLAIGSVLNLHPAFVSQTSAVVDPIPRVKVPDDPAPALPREPAQSVVLPEPSLDEVTNGVLAELGLTGPAAVAPGHAALRDLTGEVLKGLGAATGKPVAPVVGAPRGLSLQSLVATALRAGKADAEIDAAVNRAADRGDIRVPKALITSEGRVDTAALLADLLAKATRATGELRAVTLTAADEAAEPRAVQAGADVAADQRRYHTVQRGDSLGALAVRFYGDITRFGQIYDANRLILSSPDKIRVGQRLVIPAA